MAQIMNVDYEAMPNQAKQMREYAIQLNSEFKTVYSNIGDMHNSWYGIRYNELVKDFNNLIPQVNKLLDLVVTEIPFTLETIANNYSQADRGQNATSAEQTAVNKVENLPIINDVGMRFITEQVANTQNTVTEKFEAIKELMNRIESEYAKVQWQSEASDSFKARFTQLKNEIMSSLDNINSQFTKLMNETQQDIERTEKANTVQ